MTYYCDNCKETVKIIIRNNSEYFICNFCGFTIVKVD